MTVELAREGSIATLTLNRPGAGNRLDRDTVVKFKDVLSELAQDEQPPAVLVISSAGVDFSLGREPAPGELRPAALAAEFNRIQEVNELVQRAPFVTVAAIRGRAFGAGLSLAARCDLVIAADSARLAFPEVPHGIPPTIVLSHYRYVLPRKALLDLILTGREIGSEEAVSIGLISRVVAEAQLDDETRTLAAQLASFDARTLSTVKKFMNLSEGLDPRDAPALGIQVYANEMVDRAFDHLSEDGA